MDAERYLLLPRRPWEHRYDALRPSGFRIMLDWFHDNDRDKTAGGDEGAFACLDGVNAWSVGWLESIVNVIRHYE